MGTQREIIYTGVADGMPDPGCFRLVGAPLPRPAGGQVLARTHFTPTKLPPVLLARPRWLGPSILLISRRAEPRPCRQRPALSAPRWGKYQALDRLLDWYRAGRLKFHETVAQGLEATPAALINMLLGGNIGKQVVRLAAATQ